MPQSANLFAGIPADISEELFTRLAGNDRVTVERIVSRGHVTAEGEWYDQERNEWVMVVKGRAKLLFEGEEKMVDMGPGDHLTIPAHVRHRVAWTDEMEETVWLAVHF